MTTHLVGEGFEVTLLGRAGMRYREGARVIEVDCEMLTGEADVVLYSSSIRRSESCSDPILERERERIVANIRAVFRDRGMTLEVAP